jgi:hypothetical protein
MKADHSHRYTSLGFKHPRNVRLLAEFRMYVQLGIPTNLVLPHDYLSTSLFPFTLSLRAPSGEFE